MFLLQDRIGTVDNLIKSRVENRNPQVIWKETWRNWSTLRAVTADLKYFAWSLVQDMLETPSRNHRGGKDKNCKMLVYNGRLNEMEVCGAFGDLEHTLAKCGATRRKFGILTSLLGSFIGRVVTVEDLLFLSLHHFDGKKQRLSVWITVHALHWILTYRDSGGLEMMLHLKKELFWHQALERWFCGKTQMMDMMEWIQEIILSLDV